MKTTQIPSPQNEVWLWFVMFHGIYGRNDECPRWITVVVSIFTTCCSSSRWITQPVVTSTKEWTEWWIVVHTVIMDVCQLPEWTWQNNRILLFLQTILTATHSYWLPETFRKAQHTCWLCSLLTPYVGFFTTKWQLELHEMYSWLCIIISLDAGKYTHRDKMKPTKI